MDASGGNMSRWKELPAELDPRVRQLVVRLRLLKDRGELSVRQLATKTGYSAKSWERYLGGRSLAPPDAVEAMARITGDDPTRLLALREVAAEAWREGRASERAEVPDGGPGQEAAPPELEILLSGAEAPPLPGRALRIAVVAGSAALLLAVSSAVLVTLRLGGGDSPAAAPVVVPVTTAPTVSTPAYDCLARRSGGRWYAGNSRTMDATVAYGSAGPEVAEAQCLLRRAGISPGGIDGMFGPLTRGAVLDFQKRAGLVADGVVGPHTWKALRR